MSEAFYGLGGVVLSLRNARALEIEDLDPLRLFVLGCEDHLECTCFVNKNIFGAVLITESVASNYDRLFPPWNETGYARNDNRFAKDCPAEDVSNGAVWRKPH